MKFELGLLIGIRTTLLTLEKFAFTGGRSNVVLVNSHKQ